MKSKLTKQKRDRIVELIEMGNYANVAARAAGITEQTFYNWMNRGERAVLRFEEEPVKVGAKPKRGQSKADWETAKQLRADYEAELPFMEFFESVELAKAKGETSLVEVVYLDAVVKKDAKTALEMLRRKNPERWNPGQQLDITSTNTTTIKDERPNPEELSLEELNALMKFGTPQPEGMQ